MAKPGKRIFFRHNPCQQRDHQRYKGNKVVSPPAPDQKYENEKQQPE
jgi:hypothetical protein